MSGDQNPPAFPNTGNSAWSMEPAPGMTLRDWFAGQFALVAGAAGLEKNNGINREGADRIAASAYMLADAMLAARGDA